MGDRLLRWSRLVLTALALRGVAHATRYMPLGATETWDRWRHRTCILGPGKVTCWTPDGRETIKQ